MVLEGSRERVNSRKLWEVVKKCNKEIITRNIYKKKIKTLSSQFNISEKSFSRDSFTLEATKDITLLCNQTCGNPIQAARWPVGHCGRIPAFWIFALFYHY